MERSERSALKLALSEFCVMFVVTVVWNLVRKTDEGIFDAFGISAITALFVYFFAR